MLHGDAGQVGQVGQLGQNGVRDLSEVGVQVVGDPFRSHPEQVEEAADALHLEVPHPRVRHFPDVLAEKGFVARQQAERIFHVAAQGQHGRGDFMGQRDGFGGIAAGATDEQGRVARDQDHAVVVAVVDGAIVEEEGVGQRTQVGPGVVIGAGDGLIPAVAAGHHQRAVQVPQQQVVQGRVGQHDAHRVQARGDGGAEVGVGTEEEQDDGRGGGSQGLGLSRGDAAVATHGRQIGHHHGQGFVRTLFALPQTHDRVVVRGVAGEMEAAQALDGQDVTFQQQVFGPAQRVLPLRDPISGHLQPDVGPAVGAGVGLGVEATVERVFVFGPAGVAHDKGGHGGGGPVVGQGLDDAEAGAAVGAVDEGIAIAAVRGIKQLAQAVGAGGHVGRDQGKACFVAACQNDKARGGVVTVGGQGMAADGGDAGQGRGLGLKRAGELVPGVVGSPHFDVHALAAVAHPTAERVGPGQAIDKGPEAHALHDAVDVDVFAVHLDQSPRSMYVLSEQSCMCIGRIAYCVFRQLATQYEIRNKDIGYPHRRTFEADFESEGSCQNHGVRWSRKSSTWPVSHWIHASSPSPVLAERGKKARPGFRASTPRRK